jgi:hypothetical protein
VRQDFTQTTSLEPLIAPHVMLAHTQVPHLLLALIVLLENMHPSGPIIVPLVVTSAPRERHNLFPGKLLAYNAKQALTRNSQPGRHAPSAAQEPLQVKVHPSTVLTVQLDTTKVIQAQALALDVNQGNILSTKQVKFARHVTQVTTLPLDHRHVVGPLPDIISDWTILRMHAPGMLSVLVDIKFLYQIKTIGLIEALISMWQIFIAALDQPVFILAETLVMNAGVVCHQQSRLRHQATVILIH